MVQLINIEELVSKLDMMGDGKSRDAVMNLFDSGLLTSYPAEILTVACMVDDAQIGLLPHKDIEDYVEYILDRPCLEGMKKYIPKAKIDPSGQDLFKCQTMYRKSFLMIDSNKINEYVKFRKDRNS